MVVALEDSNCAMLGSDEDKQARHESALAEEAWQLAGKAAGIQVWRIEQFKVVPWTKFSVEGIQLFSGDSYIVLETTQVEDVFDYDIYFWLGKNTSIDERGVAAYKTVELDAYFDGTPCQTREVQGKESAQFKKMFPKITYMAGGVGSGFRETGMEATFIAVLFQVRKVGGSVVSQEVTLERESLNQGDSFVLSTGTKIYVWQGDEAGGIEKYSATAFAENLETEREDSAAVTSDLDDDFWQLLGGEGDIKSAAECTDRIPEVDLGEGILLKLTDEDGELKTEEVARGELSSSMLDSAAVMMLDRQSEIFVWIGSGASDDEKKSAYMAALAFLKTNDRDAETPIHLYKEGKKIRDATWTEVFAD